MNCTICNGEKFIPNKIDGVRCPVCDSQGVVKKTVVELEACHNPELVLKANLCLIELDSVRASDGIAVFYDLKRNGWVVYQQSFKEDENGEIVEEGKWSEAAFIPSWAKTEKVP